VVSLSLYKPWGESRTGAGTRLTDLSKGGDDILTFTRANGDKLFYNPATNEFEVMTKDKVISTYFKPKEGFDYWLEQIASTGN
jgi:hypothetical protein